MKEAELRSLIGESNLKPIRICMDDGRTYTISHPDFGLVGEGALVLGSGPGHNLDGASFVVCYFEHIARVELPKKKAKAT